MALIVICSCEVFIYKFPFQFFLLVPAIIGVLFWARIILSLQSTKWFTNKKALREKINDSIPAFVNFSIASLIYFAIRDLDYGDFAQAEKALVLGLYLITIVIILKRLNEVLLLAVLPKVRKTETVLDDQILLFVFATLKYSIIPLAIYYWLIHGVGVELNAWAKAGFAISIAAIGFAFRNIINDFLASVIINMEQEIRVKDYITVNGHTGKVWKIEPRYTILKSLKGEEYVIPNSDLINNLVVNHSKRQFISVHLTFSIRRNEDIDLVALRSFIQNECGNLLLTDHELSEDPIIDIHMTDLLSESKQYTITFLIKSSTEGSGKVIFTENKKTEREIEEKIFNYIHDQFR